MEFEDDTRYICFEYHKDKANAAALRLLQLLHAKDRIDEELATREETQRQE